MVRRIDCGRLETASSLVGMWAFSAARRFSSCADGVVASKRAASAPSSGRKLKPALSAAAMCSCGGYNYKNKNSVGGLVLVEYITAK